MEEYIQLKETFNEMDADHDNYLTIIDLLRTAENFHVNVNDIIKVFNKIDANKNGKISYEQYSDFCLKKR